MGMMVIDDAADLDATFIIQWWLPPLSSAANFRPGRKKHVVDLFGKWKPFEQHTVAEAGTARLPPVLVPVEDILEIAEVEDGKISFKTLDRLRLIHKVDSTGLSVSMTHEGNRYRAYVLMHVGHIDEAR